MESFRPLIGFEKEPDFEEIKKATIDFLFTYEQEKFYMDKGGVGTVYDLENGYCLKILDERHTSPNRHLFDLGNHPNVELGIQSAMSTNNFEGKTRAPRIIGSITSDVSGERNALVMEKLNAINVEHVINDPSLLPDNFDIDVFFNDLENYVHHMHEVDGVIHNDLFARNIMIDLETGEPRVIDFGRSVSLNDSINDVEKKELIKSDYENLDNVFLAVSALQK